MVRGIIIEGIAGSGKTTLRKHLMHRLSVSNASLISINEYCTERCLEPLKDAGPDESAEVLTGIVRLLNNFQNLPCRSSDEFRKLFILERFHMSHCLDIANQEFTAGYRYIDRQMKELNAVIVLLTLEPSSILERSVISTKKTRPASWSDYLSTLGPTDQDVAAYYQCQQELFISFCGQSAIPFSVFDATNPDWTEMAGTIAGKMLLN